MQATEAQLGWAAGIMDGEGYFSIYQHHRKDRNDRAHWMMGVRVNNSDPRMCAELKALFGGTMSGPRPTKGGKPSYEWSCRAKVAVSFIEQIQPHLVIKRDQAQVCLAFAKTLGWQRGPQRLPLHIHEQREGLGLQLRAIRAGGV